MVSAAAQEWRGSGDSGRRRTVDNYGVREEHVAFENVDGEALLDSVDFDWESDLQLGKKKSLASKRAKLKQLRKMLTGVATRENEVESNDKEIQRSTEELSREELGESASEEVAKVSEAHPPAERAAR